MQLLIIGAIVTSISWFVAWARIDVLSEYAFFPLWLGYILIANGASGLIVGSSLLSRLRWQFLSLFVASIPMWWFFEYMNSIVHNWHYIFAHPISTLHFNLQASINFSTVIPA